MPPLPQVATQALPSTQGAWQASQLLSHLRAALPTLDVPQLHGLQQQFFQEGGGATGITALSPPPPGSYARVLADASAERQTERGPGAEVVGWQDPGQDLLDLDPEPDLDLEAGPKSGGPARVAGRAAVAAHDPGSGSGSGTQGAHFLQAEMRQLGRQIAGHLLQSIMAEARPMGAEEAEVEVGVTQHTRASADHASGLDVGCQAGSGSGSSFPYKSELDPSSQPGSGSGLAEGGSSALEVGPSRRAGLGVAVTAVAGPEGGQAGGVSAGRSSGTVPPGGGSSSASAEQLAACLVASVHYGLADPSVMSLLGTRLAEAMDGAERVGAERPSGPQP